MEERFEVKTYEVEYYCDNCKHGKMVPTGKALMSYPQQYEHECDTCGLIQHFNNQYPKVKHERQNVRFQDIL